MDVHFCAHVLPAGSVKHARAIESARKTTTSTARMAEKVSKAHNGKKILFFFIVGRPLPACLALETVIREHTRAKMHAKKNLVTFVWQARYLGDPNPGEM